MRIMSRARPVLLSVLVLGAFAAPATASTASMEPSSLVVRANATPVDIAFVDTEPCVLTREHGNTTMHLRCGARLQHDHQYDVAGVAEWPTGLSVGTDHLDIVGWTRTPGGAERPLLVRTTHDGARLSTWGDGGFARLGTLRVPGLPFMTLDGVATLPDGSVLVAGAASNANHDSSDAVGFVAHIDANGDLDTTFGEQGVRVVKVSGKRRTFVNAIRHLADGTILVVGTSANTPSGRYGPYAMLFDASGVPVSSFSGDGVALPTFAAGATTFSTLPDERHVTSFPVPVSVSRNVKGTVYSFVDELQADGTLRPNWGGQPAARYATLLGMKANVTQGMDIDVAHDGSVMGAAEVEHAGDYDSFVARFGVRSGAIDTRFGTYGIEAIDTVLGALDDEYTMAMALDARDRAWVVGGREVHGRASMHMFRTFGQSMASSSPRMSIVRIAANGSTDRCGRTRRSPCTVRRGSVLTAGSSVVGWPTSGLALLKPVFHVWSKSPRGTWTPSEHVGRTYRFGARTAAEARLRLPAGDHEITVTRNGAGSWGSSWYGTLYVHVR
jgi:hypothetical protein